MFATQKIAILLLVPFTLAHSNGPFAEYANNEVEILALHKHGCYAIGTTADEQPLVKHFQANEFVQSAGQVRVSKELIVGDKFHNFYENFDESVLFSKVHSAPTITLDRIGDVVIRDLQHTVFESTHTVHIRSYAGELLKTFDLARTFPKLEVLFITSTNLEHINPAWDVKTVILRQPPQNDRQHRQAIHDFFVDKPNMRLSFNGCRSETWALCEEVFESLPSYDVLMELSQIRHTKKPNQLVEEIHPQ